MKPLRFYVTQISILNSAAYIMRVKAKAIPLQACTGPVVSRRLRLTDFKTIAT